MRGQNRFSPAPELTRTLNACSGICLVGLASLFCSPVLLAQSYSMTALPNSISQGACIGDDVSIQYRVFTADGYNRPVSFSYPNLPSNFFSIGLAPVSVTPTLQGAQVVGVLLVGPGTLGPQVITLRGIGSDGLTRFANSTIDRQTIPGAPRPVMPEFGASTSTSPRFEWTGALYAKTFRLQIASGDSFIDSQMVYEQLVIDQPNPNALDLPIALPANQTFYWRVQGENHCGTGFFSPIFPFFTGGVPAPVNLAVPDDGTEVVHEFNLTSTLNLADLDLQLRSDHPRVGDLAISLSHQGQTVELLSPGSCGLAGIAALFDDAATVPVAQACGPETGIEGGVKPNQALAAFNGLPIEGLWQLRVRDTVANGQSGRLTGISLQPKAAPDLGIIFANGLEQ